MDSGFSTVCVGLNRTPEQPKKRKRPLYPEDWERRAAEVGAGDLLNFIEFVDETPETEREK